MFELQLPLWPDNCKNGFAQQLASTSLTISLSLVAQQMTSWLVFGIPGVACILYSAIGHLNSDSSLDTPGVGVGIHAFGKIAMDGLHDGTLFIHLECLLLHWSCMLCSGDVGSPVHAVSVFPGNRVA